MQYIESSQPGPSARAGVVPSGGALTAVSAASSSSAEVGGVGSAATDLASTLSGGPRDSLSVLICLNLALVYIRKSDTRACEVCPSHRSHHDFLDKRTTTFLFRLS